MTTFKQVFAMKLHPLSTLIAAVLLLPVAGSLGPLESGISATPATASLLAQADPAPLPPDTEQSPDPRWFEAIDLSDTQLQQIRSIRDQARDTLQPLHQELRQERQTLRGLMASDVPAAELRSHHDTIQTLQQQLGDERFETMLAIRDVLTPDQRATLAELAEQRRQQWREQVPGPRRFNGRPFRGPRQRGDGPLD
ncbi:uncharacterized protein XM38_033430 [Halomicronema hongdechloris C2206]|uniref:Periplasmic heavy metal sensor n=1 Tax=Halomicronema hongdechloris C2206 TaxID=1641165 RepID=A0A1Z3HQ72_9CYAN|nr:Spy/CpxP family protein refolding chaperone [Halomicronema hongdechloris]ASC72386.1 uncharacterized protein XM38_033430 [Halomicronema hongdechloris C2206]